MSDPITPTDLTAHWKQQIDQWRKSGQSQAKFCQTNDLPYHRFVYWRSKFERGTNGYQEQREGGGFATVDYRHDASSVA